MSISSTSSVHWRWNETDVSQFKNQINLGPVTGTVSLSYKSATGSFMVSPTIRMSLSTGFHTPSGSLALIPLDIDELPKNIRIRFFVDHFSASGNIMSDIDRYNNLCWGFVVNCSSGTTRGDFNGTFYSIPFNNDIVLMPKPLNSGSVNFGSSLNSGIRIGMVTSSYSYHDWHLKHLSMTGSSLSGTDIEAWTSYVNTDNWYTSNLNHRDPYYSDIHWSGSAFSGKILNKIFLGFYYNPPSANYFPVTGAYVEIDNLQILKHPAGNGIEYQPPPVTSSFVSGTSDPSGFSTSLTYWTVPSGALRVVSGNKITRITRFSGTTHFFGNAAAAAPITSSTIINGTSFISALFSGSTTDTFLTSSTSDGGYVSGSAFRVYAVVNILTATSNNGTIYNNHVLMGDTSGWWGIYFRNNGNGSGTLDCYGWDGSQVTASFDFKFGQPLMVEYWRDNQYLYSKLNNTGSVVSSSISTTINVAAGSMQINKSGDDGSQWHLVEFITTNANSIQNSTTVGVGNYLAQKYGFSSSVIFTGVGGEQW